MPTKILTANFTNAGVPQLGLSPVITIYQLDAVTPTTNPTVVANGATVEIGQGWYRYDFLAYDPANNYVFTFDGGGGLAPSDRYKHGGNESYTEEIAPAVWDASLISHVDTGTTGEALSRTLANTNSIVISEAQLAVLINTLLKYERNRTRIDTTNAQMVVYDDDGVTPLTIFNLRDFAGMPSVAEVCERIPV